MANFLRQYSLTLGEGDNSTLIEASDYRTLRIMFDVQHEWGGNRSMANIAVYGFSRATEGRIFKKYDKIELSAGYADSLGLIFSGDIKNVVKERNGPDRITRMFALSGAASTDAASISATMGAGTTIVDIINICGEAMGLPVVIRADDFADDPVYARGTPLVGDPVAVLRGMSGTHGFDFSIENSRLRVQKKGTSLRNSPIIIGQDSGMIGSPEITEIGANVSVNLSPKFRLGQRIEIDSRTPQVSISSVLYQNIQTVVDVGVYTVQEINHTGDSHSDNWETKLTGFRFA